MLERACAQTIGGIEPPRVSINLSAYDFHRANIVSSITECLGRHALRTGQFEIEITESIMMNDTAGVAAKLRELRAAGISVAIDDFGTGPRRSRTCRNSRSAREDRPQLRARPRRADDESDHLRDHRDRTRLRARARGGRRRERGAGECAAHSYAGYLFARPAAAADAHGWLLNPDQLFRTLDCGLAEQRSGLTT